MHNNYYFIILAISIIFFALDKFVDYLNTINWTDNLPEELKWIYDEEKYQKSMNYQKELHKFSKLSWGLMFILSMLVLIFFWYWLLDNYLRSFTTNDIYLALAFFWIIQTIWFIIWKPFSWYSNFHIEEKYWFNKMTPKLFFLDSIKELLITYMIWWLILSLLVWTYSVVWPGFWIYAWAILTAFSLFMLMFYSSLIVPLFNKQTLMEDSDLKTAIRDFAKKVWFELDNIFVIDWSKRSTKANAYFTWIWAKKRIVLYDTLINEYSKEEIVAVLAHEIWHYKKKHTLQFLFFSTFQTGLVLFLFSLIITNKDVALALGSSVPSFHIWMLAFSILFVPLSEILWILGNMLSRKNEYEADNFAAANYDWKYLSSALKKLSVDNLSNLRPHSVYEFLHYSHPSLLKRLANLSR
jgi:STE24 endopeptidase